MNYESPSSGEMETINRYEKEVERIEKTLKKFLDEKDARKITGEIYDLALDIDESFSELLRDPLVIEKYKYKDGFFESKDGRSFYKALNGLGFLSGVASDSNIRLFFNSNVDKKIVLESMLKWFDDFLCLIRARVMNWKDNGSIGLVSPEILEDMKNAVAEREAKKEGSHFSSDNSDEFSGVMPEGEISFFDRYEEEMEGWNNDEND